MRILTAHGPTGGNLQDVEVKTTVAAGVNIVALDALGAELLGRKPADVRHHRQGREGRAGQDELPQAEPPGAGRFMSKRGRATALTWCTPTVANAVSAAVSRLAAGRLLADRRSGPAAAATVLPDRPALAPGHLALGPRRPGRHALVARAGGRHRPVGPRLLRMDLSAGDRPRPGRTGLPRPPARAKTAITGRPGSAPSTIFSPACWSWRSSAAIGSRCSIQSSSCIARPPPPCCPAHNGPSRKAPPRSSRSDPGVGRVRTGGICPRSPSRSTNSCAITSSPCRSRRFLGGGAILAIFLVTLLLDWYRPRFWCRYLCPLGALLGLLSWRPLLRRAVEPTTCNQCDLCGMACHGAAAAGRGERWKPAECFGCFNCGDSCRGRVSRSAGPGRGAKSRPSNRSIFPSGPCWVRPSAACSRSA